MINEHMDSNINPRFLQDTPVNQAAAERIIAHALPITNLICACCAGLTSGRQFFNQDEGYGLCPSCGDRIIAKNRPDTDVQGTYGIRGLHWDVRDECRQSLKGDAPK